MGTEKRIKKVITEYDLITTKYDRGMEKPVKVCREYRETKELLNETNLGDDWNGNEMR